MWVLLSCALLGTIANSGIAAANPPPADAAIRTTLHSVDVDTVRAIGRVLSAVPRDTVLKNSTSLEKTWNDATLFTVAGGGETRQNVSLSAGIEVKCKTCYIKGKATAQLDVNGNFNASQAFHGLLDSVEDEVHNITQEVGQQLDNDFEDFLKSLSTGDLSDAFNAFQAPTINNSFSLEVQGIPECLLQLQFDGMELYVLLETKLSGSASYTLNIYQSNTPLGIAIQDVQMGIWFSLDLMLDAEAEIDITNGFHLKLDDGVKISIPMFGNNVSDIVIPGVHFEFLPVTIESAGAVLTATLRISAHAGISLDTPKFAILPSISGGIEVAVFANMAKFVTNVTTDTTGKEDCPLKVVEYYEFAIGANAGATVAVGDETWGPQPATTIPVFYTTLADACAIKGKSTPTPTVTPRALLDGRADMKTTTISTELIFTGASCISSGLAICPASLQTTTQYTSTSTLVTVVPSGAVPSFPASTFDSVMRTVEFGAKASRIEGISGSPTSYVPPSSTSPSINSSNTSLSTSSPTSNTDRKLGGVSNKVIIGVSVGVGIPALAAIIGGCM
ncbi:uncharacterized protein BDR25DRAFT_371252 [Lindgomyces ingoldianus]|uniref:Uncharacterized protein n=1 Tax=Lindgomyces ingoldianus TaxID=673940 RepID=A0ACB6RFY0_9PLEO|nr:uncharacterized protein BDR25DRAFT_371252 [Lindgomyces ingoldianus]KAF2477230.1 hypothetical protein BDR25DRAFT_371252 [Lindgomyces ingoldianus]